MQTAESEVAYNIKMLQTVLSHLKEQRFDEIDQNAILYAEGIVSLIQETFDLIENNASMDVFSTLIRGIADRVCIYLTVYNVDNVEEREIRHFLLLKNGVKQQHKICLDKLTVLESQSDAQNEIIIKQLSKRRDSLSDLLQYCNKRLNAHKTSFQNISQAEAIIEKGLWNFDSATFKEQRWTKLYEKYLYSQNDYFQDYLSQFVHGINTLFLGFDTHDTETKSLLYGIIEMLINKVSVAVMSDFVSQRTS